MSRPAAGPATAALVAARAKKPAADERVISCVAAVNAVVRRLPVAQPLDPTVGSPEEPWPDDVIEGATMLATRLVRRENSPDGVASFAGDGVLYIRRSDPDIAMLLQLGDWAKPAVG